jgi:aqualysin 1
MKFSTKALSFLLLVPSTSARLVRELEQDPARRLIVRAEDGNKIENQYIVTLTKNAEPSVLASSLVGRNPQSKILHEYTHASRGFAVSGMTEADMLNLASQNPDSILEIEEDSLMYASQAFETPWNLDRLDSEGLDGSYSSTFTGAGVQIYVIDTGILISHEDFGGRGKEGKDFTGENDGVDSHGHGTHVASTAAGNKYGVAPGANVIPVKVLGRDGSGSNSGVIAGIDWVARETEDSGRTSVANLSLGGGRSLALNRAVAAATAKGVVMVVAAGNADANACTSSPASAGSAITVGSTMRFPLDTRSSFSNWGNCVDIFAPGSDIKAAWNTNNFATNTISGTSMASPRKFAEQFEHNVDGVDLVVVFPISHPTNVLFRCCWCNGLVSGVRPRR